MTVYLTYLINLKTPIYYVSHRNPVERSVETIWINPTEGEFCSNCVVGSSSVKFSY